MTRALTRQACSFGFLAKWGGRCDFCHRPVIAGVDFISKVTAEVVPVGEEPREKWGHTHCAQGYVRTVNENLPDEEEAA